ncbi:archaeal proteasome endopeptidase complex subunit alpha [Halorubrum sp. DTA98]|uniref:archaeal proteasome endopeptidase complex subunit alpha n=1 Tax=Halorubrum sp. DTA98 TaxID=3402163 RepID=UPI003AAB5556
MQGQSQQQAYDRGITIFSPDGRLYQVEYAREAVKRGTASVGVRAADGVVLAADKRARSPLMEPESVEKLHKADDHVGVASAGHVADARQLIDFARRQAQVNRLRYGEAIGIETLTKNITDHIQQYTQVGGARPFGVALIVGGIENGQPRLFETDPSGTPYEWKALSIGSDRSDLRDYLEEEYDAGLSTEEAVGLALDALGQTNDEELTPEGVGVATITVDDETFTEPSNEELEAILDDRDLLASEDDDEGDEGDEGDADDDGTAE